MGDKFEGAVEALSGIVELAAKPIIRKVRTVAGQEKYGQPIGSVIITDPSGKVLDTLHKGSGSLSGSPATSSFANDPKVAQHGAVMPGQGAFANKAQQATYSKPSAKKSESASALKSAAKQAASDTANFFTSNGYDFEGGQHSLFTDEDRLRIIGGGNDGSWDIHFDTKTGRLLPASHVESPNGAKVWLESDEQGKISVAGQAKLFSAHHNPSPISDFTELESIGKSLVVGKTDSSQKAQSDALQEAQNKADAAANNTKANADEIDRAKNSVLKQQKTESSFYGGVSGGAADSTRALVGAFLEAAKSGKDVYAQSGAQGWFWSDDKPMNGYVVSPTGEIHGFKAGVGKEAPVKFNSAFSSWSALLDKYTKKKKPSGPEAEAQTKSKSDAIIVANLAAAGVQGDVVKQTIDTPKGPMEIHVTPDAEIFTTGTGAIVRHKSGAFPDGYNVKYNAKGGPLLNAKMVASAKKYEAPEAEAPEAPEPEVEHVVSDTPLKSKVNKILGDTFGKKLDEVDPSYVKDAVGGAGFAVDGIYYFKGSEKWFKDGSTGSLDDSDLEIFLESTLDKIAADLIADAEAQKILDANQSGLDGPSLPDPKVQTGNDTWKVNIEGTLQNLSTKSGDKVWAWGSGSAEGKGSLGYYVEHEDGSATSYRLENSVLKKHNLSAAQWSSHKSKKQDMLTPVDEGSSQWASVQAQPLDDSDAKPVKGVANAVAIPEGDFLKATVLTPKGKQRVYVAPGAKVLLTGTGAAVAYPTGKTVKYNTVSGKVTLSNDPNPPHFAEVSVGGLSDPETPVEQATSAFQNMGAASTAAAKAVSALQQATTDLSAGKSVKGTKYGTDSNGYKGWQFTTHTSKNGSLVYTDSDQWGNTYLYEVDTLIPIAGPFAQMQEAKTWLATNGIEQKAPDTSKPLPAAHNVPDDAGKKLKPASASAKKPAEAKKVSPPKKALPKKVAESDSGSEENFYTLNANGTGAMVPHPKYGDLAVNIDKDAKIYTTGVGVVVKNPDGSGSVTSGKTGKVEKFDTLPDNKLPKSSTVEVKQKQSQTPSEAAESALQSALDSKNQKDIDAALEAEQDAQYEQANAEQKADGLADWEKELLGIPFGDEADSETDPTTFKFGFADELGNALDEGFLPDWMQSEVAGAEGTWTILTTSGSSLLVLKNGEYSVYYPYATKGTLHHSNTPVSLGNAKYMLDSEDYGAQKISVDVPASTPDTDKPAPTPSADAPSINPENVASPVKGEWIKGKKTDNGYLLLGVTADDGAPVEVTKKDGPFNGYGYSTVWDTPWGDANTLKEAKALAAKHGTIDPAKVKAPVAKAQKATKAGKGSAPAGAVLNSMGVPEVEWKGHRFTLPAGARIFEYEDGLYIFSGSDGVRVSPNGLRSVASMSQKALKDAGASQIAFGGSVGLGKYDWSQHKDENTPPSPNYYPSSSEISSAYNDKSLAALANFAEYLSGDNVPYWHKKSAKGLLKAAEITALVLKMEDHLEKTGQINGSDWARLAGAYTVADNNLPAVVSQGFRNLHNRYALQAAAAEGFDLGPDIDNLDVDQVKAYAAHRGFGPAAYLKNQSDAALWLRTEFAPVTTDAVNPRNKLLKDLQHQKVVSKVAVGEKYDKYLSYSVSASDDEKVQAADPEEIKASVQEFVDSIGFSESYYASELLPIVLKSGNLPAAAALTKDPKAAYDSLPEATKKAFEARLSIFGHVSVVKQDFPEAYVPPEIKALYVQIAEQSAAALPFTPHLASLQEKLGAANLKDLQSYAQKPKGVPASMWALVMGAVEGGDEYDADILPDASDFGGSDIHHTLGLQPTLVADAPPVVKQLLAYGDLYGVTGAITQSLTAIAETGVWGKPWADTYVLTSGGQQKTLYLAPGDKVYSHGYSGGVVVYNEFAPESAYEYSYGTYSKASPYEIKNALANDPVKEVPLDWNFDLAKSYVSGLDEKTYENIMSALKDGYEKAVDAFPTHTNKGGSILAAKNFLSTDESKTDYPTLSALGVSALPDGALAALHSASTTGDPAVPQMLEVLAKYGWFSPKEKTDAEVWADNLGLDISAPYFAALSSAKDASSFFYALNAGDDPASQYTALASAINGKKVSSIGALETLYGTANFYDTAEKIWDQLQGELGKAKKPKPDLDTLELNKINKKLGGMHSKQVWVDQHGNEWMSKAFPSDPNGDYRVDVEHTANEIARLYGYNAPATRVMELEGKHQYVQLLAPASGELGNQSWSSMPETLVQDAMVEHVIDWVVSNHDSHHGNILKTPDGQHAYGIDKGQAGRFFGKDKLAEGYMPNPEPAWYDNVYKAIRTKQMSKEQADALRDTVLRRAAQVATRNEDRFMDLMLESQKNRVQFPSKYPNAQAWADAHNARRKAVFDDFAKLYKGLYEKAGYDWGDKNTIDDYLPKKVADKFHVAPSEDLVEAVKKNGTLGVPVFYKTGVFADDSMLVYKTKDAKGGDTLRANVTLLPDADQTLMTWLKSHTIEKIHTTSAPSVAVPSSKHEGMPLLDSAYPALVDYAKTVNTHAADGEYNSAKVDLAEVAYNNLKDHFEQVTAAAEANPTELVKYKAAQFVTHEQQDTWLAHANRMLQQFEIVSQAKTQGVKVSAITDDTPFQMPVYKASKGLDTSGKPKVVDAWEFNGVIEQKWSDGNYTHTSPDGEVVKSTKGDFAIALKNGEHAPDYVTKESADLPDEVVESVVSVANVPVKVSYQPSSSFKKKSGSGFEVTEDSSGSVNFTGHEYRVEVNGITIRYQGLEDDSVARAQKGLARIEIADWDGNPDALEKVNEVLESIGLDIGDATEQTMEIGYYRRLAALAKRRKLSAKYKDLVDKKIAPTGDQAEIDAYRALLNSVYGKPTMQEFYDSKGFLPHMAEQASGEVAGSPHWLRPDSSVEDYKKWTKGRLPVHSLGSHLHAPAIAKTGLFSTEDRMRVLGEWIAGMSSHADQVSYGSSEYTYWRQNLQSVPSNGLVLEPDFAMAGSNYAASGDTFGSTSSKISSSHFDLQSQSKHSGGSNELMVKHGQTLFDGIAVMTVSSESARKQIIDYFKGQGITEIRGMKVEERIVHGSDAAEKSIKKVWDLAIEAEKKRKGKVA